jgi:hypothetical protein
VLFYATDSVQPLPFPTVFTDRFWDERENWHRTGPGTVLHSLKTLDFDPGHPGVTAPVGDPDWFVNGLDFDRYQAGGYTPATCFPFAFPGRNRLAVLISAKSQPGIAESGRMVAGVTITATQATSSAYAGLVPVGINVDRVESHHSIFGDPGPKGVTISGVQADGGVYSGLVKAGSNVSAVEGQAGAYAGQLRAGATVTASESAAWVGLAGLICGCNLTATSTNQENVTSFTCGSQSAAGTTQGTATTIIYDMVEITNSTGTNGVIIPSGCYRVAIANHSGVNNLKVYPPSGENISGQGANLARNQGSGATDLYVRQPNGQWGFLQFS